MNQLHNPEPILRAQFLAPLIAERAAEISKNRELPADLVDAMRQQGLFRLLVPASLGGEEIEWPGYLDVVQTIAYADGSAGWCFNQGTVYATMSGRAPRVLAETVWGDPDTIVANGPPDGGASAETVSGGFRLTGRWAFSSGCRHATWIAAISGGRGEPVRLHLLPKDQVDFVDIWQVQGLRGTGSFGFHVSDLFVPAAHSMLLTDTPVEPGPLYLIPQDLLFACGFAAVALGVARAGLDGTIELAADKKPRFSKRPLCEDPVVQSQVGRAESTWHAARALLHETVREVWGEVKANHTISEEQQVRLRMAGTHAIRESVQVVDTAYNLSGSSAIFETEKIQRRFQDIHAISQQVQGREAHYQTIGHYYLNHLNAHPG